MFQGQFSEGFCTLSITRTNTGSLEIKVRNLFAKLDLRDRAPRIIVAPLVG
jgi:hypothetical protein